MRGLFAPAMKAGGDKATRSALETWMGWGQCLSWHSLLSLSSRNCFVCLDISFTRTHQPGSRMLLQTKQGERLLLPYLLLPSSGLDELQRGSLVSLEILALCFSVLFVGLEPRGSLEETIDWDSCTSWLNRSMSSKSHGLC